MASLHDIHKIGVIEVADATEEIKESSQEFQKQYQTAYEKFKHDLIMSGLLHALGNLNVRTSHSGNEADKMLQRHLTHYYGYVIIAESGEQEAMKVLNEQSDSFLQWCMHTDINRLRIAQDRCQHYLSRLDTALQSNLK